MLVRDVGGDVTGDGVVPVSVVVPTVGRPALLAACLRSLVACLPRAAEIVVVDQSRGDATGGVVARHRSAGAHVLPSNTAGRGAALNAGLREAAHEVVLVTDDDCTVAPSWIGRGWRAASRAGEASIVTGRVLNEGVDVPDANVAIVVSGSSTTREYIQRLGRIIRPKESRAVLYEVITRKTGEVQTARRRRPD